MYLNANILLIILSIIKNYEAIPGLDDCSIPIPNTDDCYSPTPYAPSSLQNGDRLNIRKNSNFKLSCPPNKTIGGKFRDIFVKCIAKNSLEYNGKTLDIKDIKCQNPVPKETGPKPNLEPLYEIKRKLAMHPVYKENTKDCNFPIPLEDYNMPVPYEVYATDPSILRPGIDGLLKVRQGGYFRLACAGNIFKKPIARGYTDVLVKCLNTTWVEYEGKEYAFDDFKCNSIPGSQLVITGSLCQFKGNVLAIGFRTGKKFLSLYRICFQALKKNTLFSWYTVHTPYPNSRMTSKEIRPTFLQRNTAYGHMNVNFIYKVQEKTLSAILKSTNLSTKYIDMEYKYLSRGQLLPRSEFNYLFEQQATFYLENTVPQWLEFNYGIWRDIEKLFRRNLAKANRSRRLIVAGTYGLCTLPDIHGNEVPLYLGMHKIMSVPKFIWKLDYDLDRETGVVYIGLNNPYMQFDESIYICEKITCPGTLIVREEAKRPFVYCCTKDAFEKVYGHFDPVVYEKFR